MELQAVIMAGSRGSQMNDLTSSIPKPLLPVGNKPLIWYTVNMLERAGFKDVIIITLSSIVQGVRQALTSCKSISPDIVGISEDLDWGTLDSLRHIKEKIKTDLLILSCDLLTDFPLHQLADVHRINDTALTMLLAPARPDIESVPGVKTKKRQKRDREIIGLGGVDSKCRVVFLENEADIEDEFFPLRRSLFKQQPHIHVRTDLNDVHAYIMKKWLIDYIAASYRTSLRNELLPYLAKKQWKRVESSKPNDQTLLLDPSNDHISQEKDIYSCMSKNTQSGQVYDLSLKTELDNTLRKSSRTTLSVYACIYEEGFCMRVNTMPSYVETNRLVTKILPAIAPNLSEIPLVHASVRIQEKTQIGSDSVVAEETEIGSRVSIKRSIVGKHCVIGNLVKLSNCTILDRVVIKDGCVLQSCVICDNVEIGEKTTLKECVVGSKRSIPEKSSLTNESLVESAAMMEFD